ncbi:DinB family protein [Thermoflavifilum thermophilum]|uniref:DinB superfamily protein n=1 Tax=Thermoflavifilum thermophilum TaxID=1393122 RepID=A0A1I7NC18_9BACT|nr:DinB family protein [Thermoflavifilum thermophilum]SFV32224.1 DinB superfamily protein [Thermoflavifilum thermophilum]
MATVSNLDVWLRGPIEGIPALLQPVAHCLLQTQEDVHRIMEGFLDAWLWEKPAGRASVGFHLQHIRGVIDRLFTYTRGESLTDTQLQAFKQEGQPYPGHDSIESLLTAMDRQIEKALQQLRHTPEHQLTEIRYVGRAKLPATVIGLLFHAAEHSQRHTGQLLVTASVLKEKHATHS